jgi:hypothetical protein
MKATRRNFLRSASVAVAGLQVATAAQNNGTSPLSSLGSQASGRPMKVPRTLDLRELGQAALNGLAGTLDWENGPEFYFRAKLCPPALIHDVLSFAACGPKYWESFVMMRVMTGSDAFQDLQQRCARYLLSSIGEDGLFYCKIGSARPWDTSSPEDYANIYGQGRMIRALLAQHDFDGNPKWLAKAQRIVRKLEEIGIYKDDYVYYPTTPGYGDIFSYPKSGWKVTELRRGPQATMADLPDDTMGIPMYLGGTILPLVRYAETANDERTLELAGKLTRFVMLPDSAWLPAEWPRGVTPADHAQYRGHFHGHTMALRGILAYGVATNNTAVKNFARDGYEFSRNLGISRLGWFQEYAGKHSHETCCLADMIPLAIQLSDAGLGDYWDDVDAYVRNHLTEGQFVDLERMKALNGSLTPAEEQILQRCVGTYAGWGTPVALGPVLMNCCMANGSQALYAAWDSILRYQDSTLRINLLLNKQSPWLNIESHLPHEGRVVLRNKQARKIYIRIPSWVDRQKLALTVQGQALTPRFVRNDLVIDPVSNSAVVTLTFPVAEDVQTFTLDDYGDRGRGEHPVDRYKYRASFRGATAIKVESLEGDESKTYDGGSRSVTPVYSAYQHREYLAQQSAPLKEIESYHSTKTIRSW